MKFRNKVAAAFLALSVVSSNALVFAGVPAIVYADENTSETVNTDQPQNQDSVDTESSSDETVDENKTDESQTVNDNSEEGSDEKSTEEIESSTTSDDSDATNNESESEDTDDTSSDSDKTSTEDTTPEPQLSRSFSSGSSLLFQSNTPQRTYSTTTGTTTATSTEDNTTDNNTPADTTESDTSSDPYEGLPDTVTVQADQCELDTQSGWFASYFNYTSDHPDMELPTESWEDDNGDPLSGVSAWQGDWYEQNYFKFSRVDSSLSFGSSFFPFDPGVSPVNVNGEELHDGHNFFFGVHWKALVRPDANGNYDFRVKSDDDVWVYLDGDLIVSNAGVHPASEMGGTMTLTTSDTHVVDIYFAERHTVQSHMEFNFITDGVSIIPYSGEPCDNGGGEENMCLASITASGNDSAVDIGESFGDEKSVVEVLAEHGYTVSETTDQKGYETWVSNTKDVTYEVELLDMISAYRHVFGFYKAGTGVSTFEPLFRTGTDPAMTATSAPIFTSGDKTTFDIGAGEKIGFGINVYTNSMNAGFYATENDLNTDNQSDHAVVYEIENGYAIAFEDLPSTALSDHDHNDVVVAVRAIACTDPDNGGGEEEKPYCGDNKINQPWEQCDGGDNCSAQCQDTTINQCRDLVLARVSMEDVENVNGGDLQSNIFLGGSDNKIPANTWFALYYNGSYITDPDIASYEDVPGLAVQRLEGRLRTVLHGSHTKESGNQEHAHGVVEVWGGDATVENIVQDASGNNTLENGKNGTKAKHPGNDEIWLPENETDRAYYWSTVDIADDGFYVDYDFDAPICEQPETGIDLSLSKTASVATTTPGTQFTYTILVTNNGPEEAEGVEVTDILPGGIVFNSASTTAGSYATTTGIWTIGNIASSTTETLMLTVTASSTGSIVNVATATSTGNKTDNNPGNDTATSTVVISNGGGNGGNDTGIDLGVDKTASVATTTLGAQFTYTIAVTNNGPEDAEGVEVMDTLPAGVSFVSASSTVGSYATTTGIWTIGSLGNNAGATLTITVSATSTGDISNTATATSTGDKTDNDTNNNSDTVLVTITDGNGTGGGETGIDLGVTKTASIAEVSEVGVEFTYTISVTNSGPDVAEGVEVTDVLPASVSFVSASSTVGSYATTTGIWSVGDVIPNETETLVLTVTTVSVDSDIVNTATGTTTGNQVDNNPDNNTGTNTVVIPDNNGGGGGGSGGGGGGGSSSGGGGGTINVVDGGALQCEYLKEFMRYGYDNNPVEVTKLQAFLNSFEGENLTVDGFFDLTTDAAVRRFQLKYFGDILEPWGHTDSTGYVYILTKKKVNEIFCDRAFPVTPAEAQEITEFRAFLESLRARGIDTTPFEGGIGGNPEDQGAMAEGTSTSSFRDFLRGIFGGDDEATTSDGDLTDGDNGTEDQSRFVETISNLAAAALVFPGNISDAIGCLIVLLVILAIVYILATVIVNGMSENQSLEVVRGRKIVAFMVGVAVAIIIALLVPYPCIILPLILILIALAIWWAVRRGGDDDDHTPREGGRGFAGVTGAPEKKTLEEALPKTNSTTPEPTPTHTDNTQF